MYRAKVSGRGSYALFEPSMQAEVAARLELESDLREAIEHEQPDARLPADRRPSGRPHRRRRGARPLVASGAWRRAAVGLHPERRGERPHPSARRAGSCDARASTSPTCAARGGAAADLRLSVNLSPAPARRPQHRRRGPRGAAGGRPAARRARHRDHREPRARLRRGGTRVSPRAPRRRVRRLVRRLRDRLLVARQPPIAAHRRAEDRHLVRRGDARTAASTRRSWRPSSASARRSAWRSSPKASRTRPPPNASLELGCPFAQGYYFGRPEPVAALVARFRDLAAAA